MAPVVEKELCILWQYGLWCFRAGGMKSKRFLHKIQHTQGKLLNFKFWINGELSKMGHHFSNKAILRNLHYIHKRTTVTHFE